MDSSLEDLSDCKHFPRSKELILKNPSWNYCSLDSKYIIALTADIIVLHLPWKLVFIKVKAGKANVNSVKTGCYFKPINKVGSGVFLSVDRSDPRSDISFKFYDCSGQGAFIQNLIAGNNITALCAAGPDRFVYCTGQEYWYSVLLFGISSKAEQDCIYSSRKVDVIAASGDLTVISSKGTSWVEFWKCGSVILKTFYDHEIVCDLNRSKSWFLVRRERSVVLYSIPYLDVTRVLCVDKFVSPSHIPNWTANIVPDESFALIYCERKLYLFHILSGNLVGEQDLSENIRDICIMPSGVVLFAQTASICFVQPSDLRLAKSLHQGQRKSIWCAVTEAQDAMVRIMTTGESAFEFCTSQDNDFNLNHSIDEFIALYHILELAYDELTEKADNKVGALSTSKVVSQFQEAHQKIRRRSNKEQKQVDELMKNLGVYGVISLDDMSKRILHEYNESEDVCILQNTDIFNIQAKRSDRERFVTRFRMMYSMHLKSQTIPSLTALAIEIISFIQKFLIRQKESSSVITLETTAQNFSNYLLGLHIPKSEPEASTLHGRLFKSAALAIRSLTSAPLENGFMNILDEALSEYDLDRKELLQIFQN